jgi:hypothetical protein
MHELVEPSLDAAKRVLGETASVNLGDFAIYSAR